MTKSMKHKTVNNNHLELLNDEILFLILDKLSSNDHLALKSFSLTCKSFHSIESTHRRSAKLLRPEFIPCILRRYPFLSHLDLSLCPRVTDFQLQTASSLGPSLLSLKLTSCKFVTGLGVSDLVSKCPNLLELDLSNATELSDSAAAAIAGAKNLERLLMVRCKRVSDMGIGCIAVGCKNLKKINLKWCLRVTDLGVALLALKCNHLLSFDLSYVPITEKSLEPIMQLPYLEDLVLVGCLGVDDDGLSLLNKGHTSLKTLDLSNCQNISHTGLANLTRGAGCLEEIILAYGSAVTLDVAKCLQKFSMLQCLKLDGSLVTCSSLKMIGKWSGSLRELSLSKCSGVTDEGIASVVRKHTELRKLDITCCRKITSVSIDYITSSCTALTSLKMEACSHISKGAFILIGQRCRFLEELDVTDNELDDEGLKSISRCSRISCLKLGICLGITDEGLTQIGMHCSKLREIDLYRAIRISDRGIASIAQGCPALELINIAYCDQVTDASLVSLSKCSRLKELEARGCSSFTSEGLAAIAAGCGQLSVLDIKKCFKIDNSGMIPLARYSLNLKQINLSYCSVTDTGLLALASRSPLQNITMLHLAGLSPNGLAAALLACRGLKKVKLHESFKALLPQSLLDHMESRSCVFHWRDKAFQPQLLPSPTTGAFIAQPLNNWKYNSNIDNINNKDNNKLEDVNKISDFTFQTQTKPNDVSSNMFQSLLPSFPSENQQQQQQQSWSFQKQNEQSSNPMNATVKSEFPNSQSEIIKYEQDQKSSYEPAQYIKDQKKSEDGYNWRKYGQKQVKGSENPRSYYKCTFPNCLVKKKIEKTLEGQITEIIYKGNHNHPKPVHTRRSSSASAAVASAFQNSVIQSNDFYDHSLVPQRSSSGQMDSGATPENSSISVADDEVDMGSQRTRSTAGNDFDDDEPQAKRWRGEVENECMSAAPGSRAVREPRVVVQTTSDIDILDDGYRWRKYGQKVVKGNPNPRSYYKCTYPNCPVRKHVERAAHDLRAVITTYEGKHNHDVPDARGSGMRRAAAPPNNGAMPPMTVRPLAVNYMNSNMGNPNTYQGNQGMMASSFEGAGPLSPFTLQMLQNPGNFGFSGYMNQQPQIQPQYSENMFANNTTTTTRTKEEPKDDTLFESLLC